MSKPYVGVRVFLVIQRRVHVIESLYKFFLKEILVIFAKKIKIYVKRQIKSSADALKVIEP